MVAKQEHETHKEHESHKEQEQDMELGVAVWELTLMKKYMQKCLINKEVGT